MKINDILNTPVLLSDSVDTVDSAVCGNLFPFYLGECNIPDEAKGHFIDNDETTGYVTYKDKVVLVFKDCQTRIIDFQLWTELVLVMQRSNKDAVKLASLDDDI